MEMRFSWNSLLCRVTYRYFWWLFLLGCCPKLFIIAFLYSWWSWFSSRTCGCFSPLSIRLSIHPLLLLPHPVHLLPPLVRCHNSICFYSFSDLCTNVYCIFYHLESLIHIICFNAIMSASDWIWHLINVNFIILCKTYQHALNLIICYFGHSFFPGLESTSFTNQSQMVRPFRVLLIHVHTSSGMSPIYWYYAKCIQ